MYSEGEGISPRLVYVNLTDKALGAHKVSSRTTHELVSPPSPDTKSSAIDSEAISEDVSSTVHSTSTWKTALTHPTCLNINLSLPPPSTAWEALYPKGSINPSAEIPGGFGFYLAGTKDFSDLLEGPGQGQPSATEVVMSYRMMLERDWEWAKGGKLPGIFGGVGDLAYGCSGGRKDKRDACFDVRLMWRSNGVGELYAYLPQTRSNTDRLLTVPPLSLENADYGFSVGRGAFSIPVQRWASIALRVKLNNVRTGVGEDDSGPDGEIELWLDGVSVISLKGLILRNSQQGRIKGMHFQTFFGGNKPDWASPKDQRAWFADVTGVVIG